MALRIALAQLNLLVGDIEGNAGRIINAAARARDEQQADLIVFPELTLTGYPPEDLLLRNELDIRVEAALDTLCRSISGITAVVGYPKQREDGLYNSAGVIRDGQIIAEYDKSLLPNYSVFDEKRYFEPGDEPCVVDVDVKWLVVSFVSITTKSYARPACRPIPGNVDSKIFYSYHWPQNGVKI